MGKTRLLNKKIRETHGNCLQNRSKKKDYKGANYTITDNTEAKKEK